MNEFLWEPRKKHVHSLLFNTGYQLGTCVISY